MWQVYVGYVHTIEQKFLRYSTVTIKKQHQMYHGGAD